MKLERQLRAYGPVPLRHAEVAALLTDYRRPNDKISEWVAQGVLIRLMKGMYVAGPLLDPPPIPMDLAANRMYGPSAVSLETVLTRSGWIPESVPTTTSVTVRPTREINTPLGRFSYARVPTTWYSVGLRFQPEGDRYFSLSMAPEKALCDLLLTRTRVPRSQRAMIDWLLEDLRIPEEALADADRSLIRACAETGHKPKELAALLAALEAIR